MCLLLVLGLGVPVVPQLGLLFPDLVTPQTIQPSLPSIPRFACSLHLSFCHFWRPSCVHDMLVALSHLIHTTTL